jgi:peptidoglycan/LPS O-acetylase OafA/YrhL
LPDTYRPDIDGLRAVAILAVIAFHAFPSLCPGGFVGVDVFFVISGYLITGIILRQIDERRFGFLLFYARRLRRIFPGLLLVLAGCLIFGWFALLAVEYGPLGKHVAAGASFVSNFVLWQESGYFDTSAGLKPLLHLWSLGIEEQFYLFWPLLLFLCGRSRKVSLALTVMLVVTSFYCSYRTAIGYPVADFYSPVTRWWELMVGATLAHGTAAKHYPIVCIKRNWLSRGSPARRVDDFS